MKTPSKKMILGSILVVPLVLGVVFVAVLFATSGYVNLQYKRSVQNELHDRASFAGEAGINYVAEALTKGWYTTSDLMSLQQLGLELPHLQNSSVALAFTQIPGVDPSVGIHVVASGLANNDVCEAIDAYVIRSETENTVFSPYNWNPLNTCAVSDCWAGITGLEQTGSNPTSFTLSWASYGADSCTINGQTVTPNGSMQVTQSTETAQYALACSCGADTYKQTISCSETSGSCDTDEILHNDLPPTPTPTPTVTPTPFGWTPTPTPVGYTPTPTPFGYTPTPTPFGYTPTPSPTPTGPFCGDGVCEIDEAGACQSDCRIGDDPNNVCGDGICQNGESPWCVPDCGAVSNTPSPTPTPTSIIIHGGYCGDGICSFWDGESFGNCAADCGGVTGVCGNGICESGESPTTCANDCGGIHRFCTSDDYGSDEYCIWGAY